MFILRNWEGLELRKNESQPGSLQLVKLTKGNRTHKGQYAIYDVRDTPSSPMENPKTKQPVKIILFTDIDEFADDYAALIYLLNHPLVEIIAIVNSGNGIKTLFDSKITETQSIYLKEAGKANIPVYGEDDAEFYLPSLITKIEQEIIILLQ